MVGVPMRSEAARPTTISLAMICGDAHRDVLARCIRSVLDYPVRLVDEIVVCWNGVRDIAHLVRRDIESTHDADVDGPPTLLMTQQEWKYDFAAARNESYRQATGDWIMWLDADDVVDPIKRGFGDDIVKPLADRLAALPTDIGCVWLPYLYTDDLPMKIPRLVRRSAGPWVWRNPVHEELVSEAATTPAWTILNAPLIKHAPVQSESSRQSRNVEIMDRELKDPTKRTPWLLYHRARAHESNGFAANAVDMYIEALSKAKGADTHRRWPIAVAGALCAMRGGNHHAALRITHEAIRARPDLPEAFYLAVLVHAARKEWKMVLKSYDIAERLRVEEAAGRAHPIRLGRADASIESDSAAVAEAVSMARRNLLS